MKFVQTIDLWNTGIQDLIRNGQLKLQVGQWVTCGPVNETNKRSRFVSANKHSINVVHWQGTGKATNKLFKSRLNVKKRLAVR